MKISVRSLVVRLGLPVALAVLLVAGLAPRTAYATAGSALRFDGRDDYVAFDAAGHLALRSFTVETWFNHLGTLRPTSTGSGGVEAVPLVSRGRDDTPVEIRAICRPVQFPSPGTAAKREVCARPTVCRATFLLV